MNMNMRHMLDGRSCQMHRKDTDSSGDKGFVIAAILSKLELKVKLKLNLNLKLKLNLTVKLNLKVT